MAERETLEQQLIGAGKPVPDFVPCPNPDCGRANCRPFEIVAVTDRDNIDASMACSQCLISDDRARIDAEDAAERKARTGWDSDEGREWKAQRDRALDRHRWAVMPDSPLTKSCQAAFLEYLRAWHRMTVDSTVKNFQIPTVPPLEYAKD